MAAKATLSVQRIRHGSLRAKCTASPLLDLMFVVYVKEVA